MKKFPKVKYPNDSETDGLLNDDVVVTEKIDGANFRFSWDGGLKIGTRNHEYYTDDENIPKAFGHAVTYIENKLAEADVEWETAFKSGKWVLFGEAMHLHSLNYTDINYHNPNKGSPHVPLESNFPNVVLFDAQFDGEWANWDEFENIVNGGPFSRTRVIESGNPDDCSFDVPDESMFGGAVEGVVVRRLDGSVRAKKVTDDFKEQNAVSFEDPSKATSDAAQFVASFITDARVEKNAHKLVDEGKYDELQMSMMEDLPRKVLVDAVSENAWGLLTDEMEIMWDDDFTAEVRSKTSKKCARVLKTELQSL